MFKRCAMYLEDHSIYLDNVDVMVINHNRIKRLNDATLNVVLINGLKSIKDVKVMKNATRRIYQAV